MSQQIVSGPPISPPTPSSTFNICWKISVLFGKREMSEAHNDGYRNAWLLDTKSGQAFSLAYPFHSFIQCSPMEEKRKQTTDTLVKRPSSSFFLHWQFLVMEFNCVRRGETWIIFTECHSVHSNWDSGTFRTKVFKLLLKSGSCGSQIRGEVWGFSIRNFKVPPPPSAFSH